MSTPILIVGTGRSGTTVVSEILALHPRILLIDEPNFIHNLLIPMCNGFINPAELEALLTQEGWRGPMKVNRVLSEHYPGTFSDNGTHPIRAFLGPKLRHIAHNVERSRSVGLDLSRNLLVELQEFLLAATHKERCLIKQPSASEALGTYIDLWPDLNIVHIARRLEFVVLSRLRREYQDQFDDALAVCARRLLGITHALDEHPMCSVVHFSIEELAAQPDLGIERILKELGLEMTTRVLEEGRRLSLSRLTQIGDPSNYFNESQLAEITSLRTKINRMLGKELV